MQLMLGFYLPYSIFKRTMCMHVKKPLQIHVTYLGKIEIYCILRHAAQSALFLTQCRLFHNFIHFYKPCTKS